ncbi:MAG: diguanylate cyclase [Syntrophomonas sp.]
MRVLIADDDGLSRKLLESALISWGYETVITCDGIQAWEVLQQNNAPNLVILDWVMPGMDGIEICRKIRARNNGNYVYIILLTSRAGGDDIIKGLESGADDYVIKPFNPEELKYRLKIGQRIIELEHRIRHLASIDYLTGLLNRRAFIERMEFEINRSLRTKQELGFIITDIDHFKKVNDSYGHQAGDKVLQEIAKTLSRACRVYDLVGRYGGEEFVICLPGANWDETLKTAERMRIATENLRTNVPGSNINISVTASFGGTWMEANQGMSIDYMIKNADHALYQAKTEGRNCTVMIG